MKLGANRVVKSRGLRDDDGAMFWVVIDFDSLENTWLVRTIHLASEEIVSNQESCDELEQACFVLGTRVKRCLNRQAARLRSERAA